MILLSIISVNGLTSTIILLLTCFFSTSGSSILSISPISTSLSLSVSKLILFSFSYPLKSPIISHCLSRNLPIHPCTSLTFIFSPLIITIPLGIPVSISTSITPLINFSISPLILKLLTLLILINLNSQLIDRSL